jgi:hypothetical protein
MAHPTSPSPILGCFIRAVERDFPDQEKAKIAAHQAAIDATTSDGDAQRARHCAVWAIRKADDKSRNYPRWEELKELHKIWIDTWFGFDFGVHDALPHDHIVGKPEPLEDVKIQWVENAVAVAKGLGEEDGWDQSPWEALLVELIGFNGDAES